jgi:signal transduction histidine kinase
MIRQGAGRLDRILSDLLDTIKVKEGDISVSGIWFQEFIEEIVQSMDHCKNFERLSFGLKVEQNALFFSDKKILHSILQNLVDNSIKYQDLSKQHSFVNIVCQDMDNMIRIIIEDNGVGIVNGAQDKIFDMFYRAHSDSRGTGLGLYIVKNAVEKLGGKIELISSEGIGTKFILSLPNLNFE